MAYPSYNEINKMTKEELNNEIVRASEEFACAMYGRRKLTRAEWECLNNFASDIAAVFKKFYPEIYGEAVNN